MTAVLRSATNAPLPPMAGLTIFMRMAKFEATIINILKKNQSLMTTSNYPKILYKMNTCIYGFLNYFESVMHTGTTKSEGQKTRRKSKEAPHPIQASPDCLNMRASYRKTDNVRRNPAP